MKTNTIASLVAFSLACIIPLSSYARNTPCSGKKGGVSHCSSGKFVCKDGSISGSKQVCS